MTEPIVYVDHSEIREGSFEELRRGMDELVEFVEANEPQLLAYNVYFSEDQRRMTVVHVHADAASLAFHMRVAGRLFPRFAELIRMVSIDIYGTVPEDLVARIREKAEMLGTGEVRVHDHHAGVSRLTAPGVSQRKPAVRYVVNDVDAALPFYRRLGFEVRMHPAPGFAALETDGLRLLLNQPGAGGAGQAMPDGREPEPGGWNRVQLAVEDLEAKVAELQQDGATFRSGIIQGKGGRQILAEDPSGNVVELFEGTA